MPPVRVSLPPPVRESAPPLPPWSQLFLPMRRLEEERREVRTPLVPTDTRGVERSGSIARMLPVEAVMLGHSKLRMLWHARRSEQALLTYRVEGVEIERTLVEHETAEESQARRPARERGPILAVIDTSGSMHGLPEQVAKALVLEALRTAHAEKRPCRLYGFSGPGQVVEHALDLSPEGIAPLLDFLGLSFGGGSDSTEVMAKQGLAAAPGRRVDKGRRPVRQRRRVARASRAHPGRAIGARGRDAISRHPDRKSRPDGYARDLRTRPRLHGLGGPGWRRIVRPAPEAGFRSGLARYHEPCRASARFPRSGQRRTRSVPIAPA